MYDRSLSFFRRRSFRFFIPVPVLISVLCVIQLHAREPGEPTWRDMATDALMNGHVEESIALFEKWLDADPNNNIDWYNYACALSLHDDTTKALEALTNAVEAGYRDSSWAANDSDLNVLQELPEFKILLADMYSRKREETRALGEWRYLPQTKQGRYLLRLPEAFSETTDTLYPAVMILHGRGSNAERYIPIADGLNLPGFIFILPEAPFACDDREHGFEYWPRVFRISRDMDRISQQCVINAEWHKDIVHDAASVAPIDTNRVIVTGFSQGGASTYTAALEYPGTFIGAAPLGGWLFEEYADVDLFTSLANHNVSLFIGHGEDDESVELKHAEEARDIAVTAGVYVVFKTYPIGHRVTTEMISDLRNWIIDRSGK